jgi:hypothetical protein
LGSVTTWRKTLHLCVYKLCMIHSFIKNDIQQCFQAKVLGTLCLSMLRLGSVEGSHASPFGNKETTHYGAK